MSKEQKSVFLLGDFNIYLLNYNYRPTNEFLDSLSTNSFLLYILRPAHLTCMASHTNRQCIF